MLTIIFSLFSTEKIKAKSNADFVIGQNSLTETSQNQGGTLRANTLYYPKSACSDGNKFVVSDNLNSRVLVFNSIPSSNNVSADVVIGQQSMTSKEITSDLSKTISLPAAVFCSGGKLFIAENRNRILVYNQIPTQNYTSADFVIGQPDFVSHNQRYSFDTQNEKSLNEPQGVFSDGTRLFVADSGNNRVLIYNQIPTASNASADLVIGQSNMTSTQANRGSSQAGANTLYYPTSVYYDGNKLFIVDSKNNRVLVFNQLPSTNGASADLVIGQNDMTSKSENQGGSVNSKTLKNPEHITLNDGRIYITDTGNNRVMIFYQTPTTNNASADFMVGNGYFESVSFGQNSSGLYQPYSSLIVNSKFFVSDSSNNRVTIFNRIPAKAQATPSVLNYSSKKVQKKISFLFQIPSSIRSTKKAWVSLKINNKKVKVLSVKNGTTGNYLRVLALVNYTKWAKGNYDVSFSYKYQTGEKKRGSLKTFRNVVTEPKVLLIQ